jgi:hypothetical protein
MAVGDRFGDINLVVDAFFGGAEPDRTTIRIIDDQHVRDRIGSRPKQSADRSGRGRVNVGVSDV